MKNTEDRKTNVPYGFYLKGNDISFFNREYMPLGVERKTVSGDDLYTRLPWDSYLKLFHFNAIPAKLKNQYISYSINETTYNYIRVFYLYDDSHTC
tara:strand:- start:4007 stop:4294 length:288 start_codon:yes stop_codon:yes gene_type:complete